MKNKLAVAIALVGCIGAASADVISSFREYSVTPDNTGGYGLYLPRVVVEDLDNDPLRGIGIPPTGLSILQFRWYDNGFYVRNPGAHTAVIGSGSTSATTGLPYNTGLGIIIGNVSGCSGFAIEVFNEFADVYEDTCIEFSTEIEGSYDVTLVTSCSAVAYSVFKYNDVNIVEHVVNDIPLQEDLGTEFLVIDNPNPVCNEVRDTIIFNVFTNPLNITPFTLTNGVDGYFTL